MNEEQSMQMKEQIAEEIKSLNWDINYHESKLSEARARMQIQEYILQHLITNSNANE